MAKVCLNPIMERISGHVGDLVFRRYVDRVILARTPNQEGLHPSAAQLTHRKHFQLAVQYAKGSLATHQAWAKVLHKPVVSLTVGDYLNPPSVSAVDLSGFAGAAGDRINFHTEDDFRVASAQVTIAQRDGTPIESGSATRGPPMAGCGATRLPGPQPARTCASPTPPGTCRGAKAANRWKRISKPHEASTASVVRPAA